MKLLVAEKPSVAKDHYQKMLVRMGEKFVQRDGYLEGQNWCISWCVGHLVTLSPMDAYQGYAGSWKLTPLPCLPEKFQLDAIAQTQKQLGILTNLMSRADELVNGADAGREGNLIFDLVLDYFPEFKKKPQYRLWVNSYVEKDLDAAFAALEPISKRLNLSYAARLRQRADWLVGLNATRAYTLTAGRGKLLSVGRVQTPTLNLVVSRDREVESFKEFFVYGLVGKWQKVQFAWIIEDKVAWVEEKPLAERVRARTQSQQFELVEWKIQTKRSFPPKPFDLTDLQKEAHRRLKFSAARTLEIAQELYEKKHISYPRTDCAYITESMLAETYALAQNLATPAHHALMRPATDKFVFVNDKKVSDHYAILPTANVPKQLPKDQMDLYELIKARFLVAWLRAQEWKEGTAVIARAEDRFRTSLRVELEKGWKGLYKEVEEAETETSKETDQAAETTEDLSSWVEQLPNWKKGDLDLLIDVELKEKKKSRPKYYTEATLLTAMKTAGRQIEDEELAEAMKERGLGTPATQANIIETLKSRGYLLEEKGYLISSPLGRMLIDRVDERLKSAELTGDWEFKLRQIEKGELEPKVFSEGIKGLVTEVFEGLRRGYRQDFEREQEDLNLPCLKCGAEMQAQSWGLKCADESCAWKFPFAVAGRSLSASEIKALHSGQELSDLTGFLSKRGFAFGAGLRLNQDKEIELVLSDDPQRKTEALSQKCPACKGALVHNARMVRCDSGRCPFVLWKTVAGRTLADAEWMLLLKKQSTELLNGFRSKAGKDFNARLRLNAQFKVEFVFDDGAAAAPKPTKAPPAVADVQCPQCQSPLYRGRQSLGCLNQGCGWTTPLEQAGIALDDRHFVQILGSERRSEIIEGFVGSTGSKFKGSLILDQDHKVKFDKSSCQLLE